MLATEAHDDDGLPHTLEHLIFLASEAYPFKGTLDMLANRCLAELDVVARLRAEMTRREAELSWMRSTRLWRARSLTLRALGRRPDRRRFRR